MLMVEFLKKDIPEYPENPWNILGGKNFHNLVSQFIPVFSWNILLYFGPLKFGGEKIHNVEFFEFLSLIPTLSRFLLGFYPYKRRSRRICLDMFLCTDIKG